MTTLNDQPQRDLIANDTSGNLFVEAGAGSGKTRSLVDRVSTLVLRDGVSLLNIAAVTFTEKAGAELRDRLRSRFEKHTAADDPLISERAQIALEEIDSSAIGTLHSFAQRILTMHSIEAGIPPLLEVLDEVGSSVSDEERWAVLQRELLDDDEIAESLDIALTAGVKLEHLRSLARAFGSDWDLIPHRVLATQPQPGALPDVTELITQARSLVQQRDECKTEDDRFLERLQKLEEWATALESADEQSARFEVLQQLEKLKWGNTGRSSNWTDLAGLRQQCKDLQAKVSDIVSVFADATLRPLAYWIAQKVLIAAHARAAEGNLEFHDLLVLARDLLRGNATVRESLQEQFPRLLLDEFQDTDPIQIELAVRIAGGAAAMQEDWRDVDLPPGSLFVVGDPKQSIYRFRRADIGMYLAARESFGGSTDLTTNFRTTSPILSWVNQVFQKLITPIDGAQPAYTDLQPHRSEAPEGPAVSVLGVDLHEDKPNASVVREREAVDIAHAITTALAEEWSVFDTLTNEWRAITRGDIAILLPARTSLPFLEEALDDAGISFRAESSSLVYQGAEVRDVMAAARTVADPSDALSCVTALRSPLFACGDDDLWEWKHGGGGFNILAPAREAWADHPVGQGIAYLSRLHRESRWMSPSEVLSAIIADRRVLEVVATSPRARDGWRRLRFVVDQARAWSEVEHGGLRAYLAWAARQSEESARVAEAVLPETDVDAVRIMTIHAAKGLEFPMVLLSGMSAEPRRQRGVQLLWRPNSHSVKLTSRMQTNDFEAVQPVDEQMDDLERRRLLYVATTRARDHLVVSLHRNERQKLSSASVLADAGAVDGAHRLEPAESVVVATALTPILPDPPPEWESWLASVQTARERSRRRTSESASGLEGTDPLVVFDFGDEPEGAFKGARDIDLPPWTKGRYGSAIGRAVHGALQTVDLATGAGLEGAVSAQCVAEGVTEFEDVVVAIVRSALDAEVVQRAATRPHWRETYVGAVQDDGTVLEGIVDLIYREDDGTHVIVDYKTDAISAGAIVARTHYYAPQIQAYSSMLERATGATPASRLLFIQPAGSHTVDMP